jgi:hypothetical protein
MGVSQFPAISGNTPILLGYAETRTDVSNATGTDVDVAGLAITVNIAEGRRIRVSAYGLAYSSTVYMNNGLKIKEGVTVLSQAQSTNEQAGLANAVSLEASAVLTPSAGTHTYKVALFRSGGTVTLAAATVPAYLLVEDITGVAIPAPSIAVPVGVLGQSYATISPTTASTTWVDLGCNVNVVVPAGRTLRVYARMNVTGPTGDLVDFIVKMDGNDVANTIVTYWQDQGWGTTVPATEALVSPAAGAHTFTCSFRRASGTGTTTSQGCSLIVEDVTPTPALASGAPSSTLAYAEVAANQASITAPTDLTGLSVTVTVPAGRRIRISAHINHQNTSSGVLDALYIMEGSTILQKALTVTGAVSLEETLEPSVVISPSAGVHTYKLQADRSGGTMSMLASAQTLAYILVEDVTGVSYNYTSPGLLPVNSSSPPASPSVGSVIYEYDTGKTKIYSGTGWGELTTGSTITLAYAQAVANQTATTEADMTGLSVTVTVPVGRRLRISGRTFISGSVTGAEIDVDIKEGATLLQLNRTKIQLADQGVGVETSVIVTPSAGTHTYKLTMARVSGSGNAYSWADPTFPAYILVEDITGTTVPVDSASVPVGVLGYAVNSVDQGSITTVVPLTSLSTNIVVPAGRTVRITGEISAQSTAVGDLINFQIMEGATLVAYREWRPATANVAETLTVSTVISPTAGSHTYSLSAGRGFSATGTISVAGTANRQGYLLVEDITPTPAVGTGAPGSTLGYAEKTANQSITNTQTDVTGLAATVTVPAGRRLRISAFAEIQNTQAAVNYAAMRIHEGATQLQEDVVPLGVTGANQQYGTCTPSVVVTPSAGVHTYNVKAAVQNTGGTLLAGATAPAYILVEDITGAVWPTGSAVTAGMVASEAWTSYTPAWASTSGSQPSIGNGTMWMRYTKIGRTVTGFFYFLAGSSTNYGQAATPWTWSLPLTAQGAFVWQPIGMVQCFKDGSNCAHSIMRVWGSDGLNNKMHVVFHGAQPVGAESMVGPSVPWTWATSNEIAGYFTYEAAS